MDMCVFSFEGYSKNNKHQCSISSSGVLKYQVSPKDSIAFADFAFQPSKWYHVVLSHSPPKQQKVLTACHIVSRVKLITTVTEGDSEAVYRWHTERTGLPAVHQSTASSAIG